MSKLLIEDRPLQCLPKLAKRLGSADRAIILQQIHYLMQIAEEDDNEYKYINGGWWVYNTYKQWHEKYFSWLSESAIKRHILALEKACYLETMQSVKNKSDRTKWYTINYRMLEDEIHTTDPTVQNRPMVDEYKTVPSNSTKPSDGYSIDSFKEEEKDPGSKNEPEKSDRPKEKVTNQHSDVDTGTPQTSVRESERECDHCHTVGLHHWDYQFDRWYCLKCWDDLTEDVDTGTPQTSCEGWFDCAGAPMVCHPCSFPKDDANRPKEECQTCRGDQGDYNCDECHTSTTPTTCIGIGCYGIDAGVCNVCELYDPDMFDETNDPRNPIVTARNNSADTKHKLIVHSLSAKQQQLLAKLAIDDTATLTFADGRAPISALLNQSLIHRILPDAPLATTFALSALGTLVTAVLPDTVLKKAQMAYDKAQAKAKKAAGQCPDDMILYANILRAAFYGDNSWDELTKSERNFVKKAYYQEFVHYSVEDVEWVLLTWLPERKWENTTLGAFISGKGHMKRALAERDKQPNAGTGQAFSLPLADMANSPSATKDVVEIGKD